MSNKKLIDKHNKELLAPNQWFIKTPAIAKLSLTNFKDGDLVYYCDACGWEYGKPVGAMASTCPECRNDISFVKNDKELREMSDASR